jgi:hypothetical protein
MGMQGIPGMAGTPGMVAFFETRGDGGGAGRENYSKTAAISVAAVPSAAVSPTDCLHHQTITAIVPIGTQRVSR